MPKKGNMKSVNNGPVSTMNVGNGVQLPVYEYQMKTHIQRSEEFDKKGLATHGVNVGLKCGHACTYCSTGAIVRTHAFFKSIPESAFDNGYAVVDPAIIDRVEAAVKRRQAGGTIQLCTLTDAWSPEARQHGLGRGLLEVILPHEEWTVRILTKNAAVLDDFDVIEQYRDRVLFGMSLTGTTGQSEPIKAIEPNASTITERMEVMREAHKRGFRTYGMLCPLIPGIASDRDTLDELVTFIEEVGGEEIFAEPVNARARGLILTQEALAEAGFDVQAAAVRAIRTENVWSAYVVQLLRDVQDCIEQHSTLSKLRFLLYPSDLTPADRAVIKSHDQGVIWLGE